MKKITLLFVLLLGGCAATTMNALSPTTQAPTATEGVVLVSVTIPGSANRTMRFDKITLTRLNKTENSAAGESVVLNPATAGLARDTTVFIGVLPEGEYAIERFSVGQSYLQLNERMRDVVGTFRVRAGAWSDLGRIVVTPVGGGLYVVGRSALTHSNGELVKRQLPDVAKLYPSSVNEGWIRGRSADDFAERYAIEHPYGATRLVELTNGEVVTATGAGSLLYRSKDGRWRRVSTGRLESLLYVKQHGNDSSVIAAGEFNTLLTVDRAGTVQKLDAGNLPNGNILFIDGSDATGWFVAHARGNEVTLYRSDSLKTPKWEPLKSEQTGQSFWTGADKFWIWPISGGFAYAVSKGEVHFYNYTTKQWSDAKAPNDNRFVDIETSPGDIVGILTSPGGGFGGIFAHTYFSRDRGKTWIETKSPFSVKTVMPRFTAKGTLLEWGGVFGDASLQSSTDDGVTWNTVVMRNFIGGRLWPTVSNGLFVVNERGGVETIEHSGDDGVSWTVEYSTSEK
jgi:hypothetical protein